MSLKDRVKKALVSLVKQEIVVTVTPRAKRLDPRLAPHYKAAKVRARERAANYAEAAAINDYDDAGLVALYSPCYCQGGILCGC